jgi:hypothetical protein
LIGPGEVALGGLSPICTPSFSSVGPSGFFWGEILPSFHLKNMIWTYTRIFHEKFDPHLPDFEKKFPNHKIL